MEEIRKEVRDYLLSSLGKTASRYIDELYINTKEVEFSYPTLEEVLVENLPPFEGRIKVKIDDSLCIFGQNKYGKTTLVNSIAFSLCGIQFFRIRGMNLDYYTSREFHNLIHIYSHISSKEEFIKGTRKVRTHQEFDGVMSNGTPLSSIAELEKAFVDLCGFKNLTGRQFLDLFSNIMNILFYSSENRNWLFTEDSRRNLKRLWPLIFNRTFFQKAFFYVEKKIEREKQKGKEAESIKNENRIRLDEVREIIAKTSRYDLQQVKKELEGKKAELSQIRKIISEKENEKKRKMDTLRDETDKISKSIQEKQETCNSIREQLEIGVLQKLDRHIRDETSSSWKYCKLCHNKLEDKWESRIDNNRCPICDSPVEEHTETYQKIVDAMKKGFENTDLEPTEHELEVCELSIGNLEKRKKSLELKLDKLERNREIEYLKKRETDINTEKTRLEERRQHLESYEEIKKKERELHEIIEEKSILIEESRKSLKMWTSVENLLNNFFEEKENSGFNKIKSGFEFYMKKFEGRESIYALNDNLWLVDKENNKEIVIDALNFGQKIIVDLAMRFAIAEVISECHDITPLVLLDMPESGLDKAFLEGLMEIFADVIESKRWQLVVTTVSPDMVKKFDNVLDLSSKISKRMKTKRQIKMDEFLDISGMK